MELEACHGPDTPAGERPAEALQVHVLEQWESLPSVALKYQRVSYILIFKWKELKTIGPFWDIQIPNNFFHFFTFSILVQAVLVLFPH